MLTRLFIRNFKSLDEADIELGHHVVFVGPNNSGKTTALQALSLWHTGLLRWVSEKSEGASTKKRTGVTLNRKDIFALPVRHANLLWRDLHTRAQRRDSEGARNGTENILFTIGCEGVLHDRAWSISLDFDYSNSESIFCRPSHAPLTEDIVRLAGEVARATRLAFLPPMSGLAAEESLQTPGRINVLIGQGRTAEVLRNLCYAVFNESETRWAEVVGHIADLFGMHLQQPIFDATRGELLLSYKTSNKTVLDISSAGRGMQQTLLLLTYLSLYPGASILLDEPDAHLEVLRQRQTYDLITRVASQSGSQIIAATHSEQVLDRAAGRDTVIAFLGRPHRINDQGSQLKKSLLSIGYSHYMQAEAKKWVLYLEGSTDAAILQRLAERLGHPAAKILGQAYVDYLDTNQPPLAREKFHALREAVPELAGLALFDRLPRNLPEDGVLGMAMWQRREIENYICTPEALLAWAEADGDLNRVVDLIEQSEAPGRVDAMRASIAEISHSLETLGKPSPWDGDLKVSEDFLEPLFGAYHRRLGLPEHLMRKKRFYELADFVPLEQIDPEVIAKLDLIVDTANKSS